MVVFAADYPFFDILWTMIIFFCWVAWIWLLIMVFSDLFGATCPAGPRPRGSSS